MNLSDLNFEPAKVIQFLKMELQLKDVYQKIACADIVNKVAREHDLKISGQDIQAEIERICHEKKIDSPLAMIDWLDAHMLTLSEWKSGIRNSLLSRRLANALFRREVEAIFLRQQADFDQITFYRITLPYERLAQDIRYQIEENGLSFYEAAHLYDIEERRRSQCGYEGRRYRYELAAEISDIVFNATPTEVIGPLQLSDQAYNLFLVEELIPAQLTPELYQSILDDVFNRWLTDQLTSIDNGEVSSSTF